MKIKKQLSRSERMRTHPGKHNPSKYYLYHHDHDHDTEECIQLQNKIKKLIKRGRLDRFLRRRSEARIDRPRALLQSEPSMSEEQQEDRPPLAIINLISGGTKCFDEPPSLNLKVRESLPQTGKAGMK